MLNRISELFSGRKSSGETALDKAAACKQRGNELLAKGRLDAAAVCYREAIAIAPDYAEGFNNLGFVCLQQGHDAEARLHLERAVSLNSKLANAHYNLGTLARQEGHAVQALACFEQAIDLTPDHVDARYSRGSLLLELGRNEEALTALHRVTEAAPDHAGAHRSLALALQRLGHLKEARDSCKRAISLNPDFTIAHFNLAMILRQMNLPHEAMACLNRTIALSADFAEAHHELGNILREQKQFNAAALYYEKAIALRPEHFHSHNNLGVVFCLQDEQDKAIACFQEAVRIKPDLAVAHMNLAELLHKRGRLEEAVRSADEAIALAPDAARPCITKGLALKDQDRMQEAETWFRQALVLDPQDEGARFMMATFLLGKGEIAKGWEFFGHRNYSGSLARKRDFSQPLWVGEDLHDKTILLWGDQGVGDEMLFANLFADVVARARRCIVECTPKLVPLFARSFPDVLVVPKSNPPHPATGDADVQIAAADAARWLRPDVASFPHHDGHLVPDPVRVTHWKSRLAQLGPGLKVGFGWRSKNLASNRSLYCSSLTQWGAIFAVPGVHFINLQYDRCEEELAAARREFGVALHVFEEVDLFDDLAEAAALSRAVDLVISAPTATSFLAAAVGVPTWMMTYGKPWQMMGTDAIPWFPAMQCFSRRWDQPWEDVIAGIARALDACRLAAGSRAEEVTTC